MVAVKFIFEDLKGYEKTLARIDMIYKITATFLKHETFGMSSQINRSASKATRTIQNAYCPPKIS